MKHPTVSTLIAGEGQLGVSSLVKTPKILLVSNEKLEYNDFS